MADECANRPQDKDNKRMVAMGEVGCLVFIFPQVTMTKFLCECRFFFLQLTTQWAGARLKLP